MIAPYDSTVSTERCISQDDVAAFAKIRELCAHQAQSETLLMLVERTRGRAGRSDLEATKLACRVETA